MSATTNSNVQIQPSSKQYNMQQFVNTVAEYKNHKCEELATDIVRHLQLLSVTIDYSIFDPHTPIALDFFLNLYELLTKLEPHSTIAWCCVNVLRTSCRNSATRNALITDYQFILPLCQLMSEQLSYEKKLKLLTLMQELTCGITISWQMPYLTHLMTTLSRWVLNGQEEIVVLSLSVLVNLCYKNLPAIYTLVRSCEVKDLLKHCLHNSEGPKMEVQVCKLLIILDYMDGSVPTQLVKKLIDVLFTTILESFKAKDAFHMRHSLEFFLDFRKKHTDTDNILRNEGYDFQEFFRKCFSDIPQGLIDYYDVADEEAQCVATLLQLFSTVIPLKLDVGKSLTDPTLVPFFASLVQLSLQWIQTECVCAPALSVLLTIVQHCTTPTNIKELDAEIRMNILQPIVGCALPVLKLSFIRLHIVESIAEFSHVAAVMRLFYVVLSVESKRCEIIEMLRGVNFKILFNDVVREKSVESIDKNTSSVEAIALYVNTLALLNKLGTYDSKWALDFFYLLQQKQIHTVFAQALYNGSADTIETVLRLCSTSEFPLKNISEVMAVIQIGHSKNVISADNESILNRIYPVLSNSQSERLDELLSKIQKDLTVKTPNVTNGTVSAAEIIELYDYKMATLRDSATLANNNLETAAQRNAIYQHRVIQLTAEVNRLHQATTNSEQNLQNVLNVNQVLELEKADLAKKITEHETERQFISDKFRLIIKDSNAVIEELRLKYQNCVLQQNNSESLFKKSMNKLETEIADNYLKLSEHVDLIGKLNKDIQTEKSNTDNLRKQVKEFENTVSQKSKEIEKIQKDNKELQERLKIILKVVTK